MVGLGEITQIRVEHHEIVVAQLLQDHWFLLCEPFTGLRRVERFRQNGEMYLVDIPWREFILGRRSDANR